MCLPVNLVFFKEFELADLSHHAYSVAQHCLACGLSFIGFIKHQRPKPKSANSGAESRHTTLSILCKIALYDSFVVRTGKHRSRFEAQIWRCSDDFFCVTSFFSSSLRSSHEGVSHVSFISLS